MDSSSCVGKTVHRTLFWSSFSNPFFYEKQKSNILFRILLNSWWAEMDSNHRTLTRTDLQSAAFSHSAICPFSHLKNNKWCTLKDSNLGPTGYEPVALTNWANGPLKNQQLSNNLAADTKGVGAALFSQDVAILVSSACMSLTSVFGMGTGGTS